MRQIDTGYACGGVELDDSGVVIDAAPIFQWMIGKTWCEVQHWKKIKKIRIPESSINKPQLEEQLTLPHI